MTELLLLSADFPLLLPSLGLRHLAVGLLPAGQHSAQLALYLTDLRPVKGELGELHGSEGGEADVQLEQRVRNLQQVRLCLLQ